MSRNDGDNDDDDVVGDDGDDDAGSHDGDDAYVVGGVGKRCLALLMRWRHKNMGFPHTPQVSLITLIFFLR